MKFLQGFYTDKQGEIYALKDKTSTGATFYECEYLTQKGIIKTDRTAFFSKSDIDEKLTFHE